MDEQQTERRPIEGRPVARIRIDVAEGPDTGRTFESEGAQAIAVGTAPNNELVLTDPAISRYHLEVQRTDTGVRIRDLGSSNGSFIGTTRIESVIVPANTTVSIGRTLFKIKDGRLSEPAEAPPIVVPGIVGESEAIRRVASEIERLSKGQVSVLLFGETGTGKELFARAIHELSPRRDRPFIVVDCGSMPATLIASELFGHERGAFTGADERYSGAFERAEGGTILLDEIGELPLAVQPTLLGVLERRRFRRLGGEKDMTTDVRIISATHRDLRSEVNGGNFRADLYFRLAVARITLPPLRHRPEDILHLVEHFVREINGTNEGSPFSPATIEALMAHPWSGNVRELRNVVESALALGRVLLDDEAGAPRDVTLEGDEIPSYKDARAEALMRFEQKFLKRLIDSAKGNASEAARRAKMDRPYLLSLLKKHGLR